MAVVLSALLLALGAWAQSPVEDAARRKAEMLQRLEAHRAAAVAGAQTHTDAAVAAHEAEIDRQWKRLLAERERRWQALRAEVERQWQKAVRSSRKMWADYSPDRSGLSQVDFEQGSIHLRVVIPEGSDNPREVARQALRERAERVFHQEGVQGVPLLQGQVAGGDGRPVSGDNLDRFLEEKVLPQAEAALAAPPVSATGESWTPPAPNTVAARKIEPPVSRDGVQRVEVDVAIPLVPEHIRIRARRYKSVVDAQAHKDGLPPQLLFAVIHTESSFNPLAESPAGAYGLMQLIPRYAAKEAWEELHHESRLVSETELLDPDLNIELGSTYLRLLRSRYFGRVEDPEKNLFLSIMGYNWGPTSVTKKLLSDPRLAALDAQALMEQVTHGDASSAIPQETRDYLPRVAKRMSLYDGFYADKP